jgi:hypothetical protein
VVSFLIYKSFKKKNKNKKVVLSLEILPERSSSPATALVHPNLSLFPGDQEPPALPPPSTSLHRQWAPPTLPIAAEATKI